MNREIKKFIQRLVRFVFPYFILAVFTITIFYRSGEIFWFNKTLKAQTIERRNFIFGAAYSNLPHNFRLLAVENISPKVIALGASRILQFRAAFFKDSIPFYTTGGVFKRLEQLRAFLESIPEENLPQTIILGLDQWWFNARYDSAMKTKNDLIYNQFSWVDNFEGLQSWQNFYYDWWNGKIILKKIWNDSEGDVEWFGISGRMASFGYRKDGSRAYGNIIANGKTIKNKILNSVDSVKADYGIFRKSAGINAKAVNELRMLLRFCKKHKIIVTGFLPPVDELVLVEMKKNDKDYSHFFKLYEQIAPVFRDYGFHVYDFLQAEKYGSSTNEMIDAVHGSEKSYLKLYLQLLRKDTYLNQFSDSTFLITKLDSAKGNFDVFGN